MTKSQACLALTGLLFVAGCGGEKAEDKKSTEGKTSRTSAKPETNKQETEPVAVEGKQASVGKPAPEAGEFLGPPDMLPDAVKAQYESLVEAAEDDPGAMLRLADASQQIGVQLAQGGNKMGYKYMEQSGRALRKGLKSSPGAVPDSVAANIYYNEACALCVHGKPEAAHSSLKDAITLGFDDFNLVQTDTDIADLRKMDGFEADIAKWKAVAAKKAEKEVEREREEGRQEIVSGESFPFELKLTDLDGNEQTLEKYKGKVVVVDFWGTWCPPCRAEIPSFIKLQEKYGADGFQILGINYERKDTEEENKQAALDYIAEVGINYPCMMGDDATKAQVGLTGYPTTVFIDKTGKVRAKISALHPFGYLEGMVSELMAE